MINASVKPADPSAAKVIEVIQTIDHDDFGTFLENDVELQMAYTACQQAAGIEWTDEDLAESVNRAQYGEKVDDLMQFWRQQQVLLDPTHPEHQRASAVHAAVMKWKRSQAYHLVR
jgi:hypothetical protein